MLKVMDFAALVTVAALVGGCTNQRPVEMKEQAQEPAPAPGLVTCGIDRPGPPVRVSQGIAGVVCFWQGDFQPGDSQGTIRPLRRTVEIHAATRREHGVRATDAAFWGSVSTPLIATVESGDDGWFEVALPPGTYSMFVREPQGLYANGENDDGVILPVQVEAGAVARTQLDVDYASAH